MTRVDDLIDRFFIGIERRRQKRLSTCGWCERDLTFVDPVIEAPVGRFCSDRCAFDEWASHF